MGFDNGLLYVEPARDRARAGATFESSWILTDVAAAVGEAGIGACNGVIGAGMEARLWTLDRGGGLGATCGGMAVYCTPLSSKALPSR